MTRPADADLISLGDQVEALIVQSRVPLALFVLATPDGRVEYRSRLSTADLKVALLELADAF